MAITETQIRELASVQSFERGQDYFYGGAVGQLQKRGEVLWPEVQGGDYEPYEVRIELTEDELVSAACTCPYDWGGACKHIVAVLLTYLHRPEQVAQKRSVDELLANLSEAQLRDLLQGLLANQPGLIDRFIVEETGSTLTCILLCQEI